MGIFEVCDTAGVFAVDRPTQTSLAFIRQTRDQNSAGELILSFASTITISVDLQPDTGRFLRSLHGQLTEIHFTATAFGTPDIQPGDRTTISAAAVEVTNVRRYGTELAEIDLRWVR